MNWEPKLRLETIKTQKIVVDSVVKDNVFVVLTVVILTNQRSQEVFWIERMAIDIKAFSL